MNFINFLKRKFNYKTILLTLTSVFFLFIIYYGTMAQASRPELCTVCHMMKPEFYSWQASSHEKVPCLSCHDTGDPVNKLKKVYYAATNTYMAPIIMTKTISDQKCEKCHKVNQRTVTPSGDLIIPHQSHKDKKIACVKCHRGVAHGHINERKVTYKSDYGKWDATLAKSLMTDDQTRTLMDTCMRCHEVRKAPMDCKVCHRTSMLPESHKVNGFKQGNHGKDALKDVQACDQCHGYMSPVKYEGFQEQSIIKQFFESKSPKKVKTAPANQIGGYNTAKEYSRINKYCKDCHSKKPPSHTVDFMETHKTPASKTRESCMVCHDNQVTIQSVTQVGCSDCHPASHYKNWQWKVYHPIPLESPAKLKASCYQCHDGEICSKCHKGVPAPPKPAAPPESQEPEINMSGSDAWQ